MVTRLKRKKVVKRAKGLAISRAILDASSKYENLKQDYNNTYYGPHGREPQNSFNRQYYIRTHYWDPTKWYMYDPRNPKPMNVQLINKKTMRPIYKTINKPTEGLVKSLDKSLFV